MMVLGKQSPLRRLEKYGGNYMNYMNRLVESLIAVVFILSLFSGVAIAEQTPAEQYKEKYENTKKKFEEARNIFESARERLRNANDNKSTEELKNRTKDYLLRAIDQTVSHLEILKNRAELVENKDIFQFDANGNIEAHMTQVEEMKVKLEQAETIQDFRDINSELKDLWVKIRLETRYYVGIVINYRSNIFLSKADNVSVKMDEVITSLENESIDTASLKAEAEKFASIVADAKQDQQKTDDLFEVHDGFASDGTLSDANSAAEFLRQGDSMQRETVKNLKEAAKLLKDFVKESRKLKEGLL